MQLLNLSVDRLIIHQVFRRDMEGKAKPPIQSHEYTRFDKTAMSAFHNRVIDALGDGSKAVQMEIVNQDKTGLPSLVERLIDDADEDFVEESYEVAVKLSEAQHNKIIPGGIIVIFTGTQGPKAQQFLGIIKAEVHSGYEKIVDATTGEISLKFVQELLLTPGSRLYKTAGFFRMAEYKKEASDLNSKLVVMVSDNQISKIDGKAAAQYFFSSFLGCGYPESSAKTTRLFYESTKKYIGQMDATPEKKNDYLNALVAYLKVDSSSTASASEFGERVFENTDIQDKFQEYMKNEGLPSTAFTKDLDHIQSRLKFRKVTIGGAIKITAPSDVFKESVLIESIDGDPDESGAKAKWTKVIIKDKITKQE